MNLKLSETRLGFDKTGFVLSYEDISIANHTYLDGWLIQVFASIGPPFDLGLGREVPTRIAEELDRYTVVNMKVPSQDETVRQRWLNGKVEIAYLVPKSMRLTPEVVDHIRFDYRYWQSQSLGSLPWPHCYTRYIMTYGVQETQDYWPTFVQEATAERMSIRGGWHLY